MTTSSRQTRLWIEIDSKFYCTADRRPNVNAKHLFRTTTLNLSSRGPATRAHHTQAAPSTVKYTIPPTPWRAAAAVLVSCAQEKQRLCTPSAPLHTTTAARAATIPPPRRHHAADPPPRRANPPSSRDTLGPQSKGGRRVVASGDTAAPRTRPHGRTAPAPARTATVRRAAARGARRAAAPS